MVKKEHKFFEIFLDNDLNKLYDDLHSVQADMIENNFFRVPEDIIEKFRKNPSGSATQLGQYYNIFHLSTKEIVCLYDGLSKLTKEACKYYGIDIEKEQYMIHGWFNLDFPNPVGTKDISPLHNPSHFHDHSEGHGAPWFHGYYCVNAEPSSTFYKIGGSDGEIFENINKNNRAIISETGHPHGRDDWYENTARITIAYDITPLEHTITERIGFIPWVPLR